MNPLKRIFIWLMILSKRTLHHYSFIALLLIIPLLIPAVNSVMSRESGVVRVALCNEGSPEGIGDKIINELTDDNTVINYTVYPTVQAAREAITSGEVDCAWIFGEDFEQKMNAYIRKESIKPFMQIIEREESIRLNLAREKLYGKIFSHMSYDIFKHFVTTEILNNEAISESELKEIYNANSVASDIIEIQTLDSDEVLNTDINYLTAPLRGLIALTVMLCGFASVAFFMKENSQGVYSWLSEPRKLIPAFGTCFSAILMAAAVMYISLFTGNLAHGFIMEAVTLFAYTLSATALCLLICSLIRKVEYFGPVIPFIMIAMLVLCPIFFSFRFLMGLKHIFPPYLYLTAQYNPEYILWMLVYSIVISSLSIGVAYMRKH